MEWNRIVKNAFEDLKYQNIQEPDISDIKYLREAYRAAGKAINCSTQVGCVLVKDDVVIASSEPIGMPSIPFEIIPVAEPGVPKYNTKYCYTWYCEMLVLKKARDSGHSPKGSTLYKLYGCSPDNIKYLILEGVERFVFSVPEDKGLWSDNMVGISIMCQQLGIEMKLVRKLTQEELDDVEMPF